jgi:hypothetical protein
MREFRANFQDGNAGKGESRLRPRRRRWENSGRSFLSPSAPDKSDGSKLDCRPRR